MGVTILHGVAGEAVSHLPDFICFLIGNDVFWWCILGDIFIRSSLKDFVTMTSRSLARRTDRKRN